MAKILITGIAGFIGSHLAKKLTSTVDEIVGIDNLNNYYDLTLKKNRLQNLGINVEGITLVLNNKPHQNYNIFNIGNSNPVNIEEFLTVMQDSFKEKTDVKYLPMQEGEVYKTYADITPMKEIFSFSPKTDIADGIRKFVSWYSDYYGVKKCVE